MAAIKQIAVSLSERPFCIGIAELMGYLGVESEKTLKENYLDKGLHPVLIGKKQYFYKKDIDRFLLNNNQWQRIKL